jgi:hypothetical protein
MSKKTAGQVLLDELEPWGIFPDPALAGDIAAKVIAHIRPEIEAEYRKRYPTGFCDCACKMDAAGDNVLSLCNTHRDYVKQLEAMARTAAIEDAATACKQHGSGTRYVYQREEFTECEAKIRAIASAPPRHMCVSVDEPFGWWTEWDGDESDFGNYIFTMDKDELDAEHLWIPLYARPK